MDDHPTELSFAELMERVAHAFEVAAAIVLIIGLVWAAMLSISVWRRTRSGEHAYQALRRSIGGVLLLGIEVLVAADLLHTVAVEPTLENVAVLGLIVVIRTVLSFSLEIEIDGVAPWRRAAVSGVSHISAAAKAGRAAGTDKAPTAATDASPS